ncbi:MAG: hypothetical protein A2289_17760 [Deltaproteobacteria bacterium RIFOXYA12_FULL_58_15]|nr:MAG: hypothetical protein A2289_17760 [Deltaproteobacteria bacterium RIFOXYA12_FULL_58_15]OGR08352.1 MAG: hypothetical protein A2341_25130 [Deltaproteobacteria bacterium RIFOXYB12_FULL_58_9]
MSDKKTMQETTEVDVYPDLRDAIRRPCLVMMDGVDVGRSFELRTSILIGRSEDADVCVLKGDVSRQHARLEVVGENVEVVDLDSVNGTWVNGKGVKGRQILIDGDYVRVGAETTLKFSYVNDVERDLQKVIQDTSISDPLTGTHNRQHFIDAVSREISFHVRHKHPISILLMDVDGFKDLNSTHGDAVGDSLLVRLTQVAQKTLREEDLFCRFGGEEFAAVLRNTGLIDAKRVAERLRYGISKITAWSPKQEKVNATVSIGIATAESPECPSVKDLLELADEELNNAKRDGHDQVRGRIFQRGG